MITYLIVYVLMLMPGAVWFFNSPSWSSIIPFGIWSVSYTHLKCEEAFNKAESALNSFADQIHAMEMKKGELKSKAIAAKSQQKANTIKSKNIAGSLSKFNEMAERIDSNLAAEEALAELTGANDKEEEDLLAKYSTPDVDDALAELKKDVYKRQYIFLVVNQIKITHNIYNYHQKGGAYESSIQLCSGNKTFQPDIPRNRSYL